MNRSEFERLRSPSWTRLSGALTELEKSKPGEMDMRDVPQLFREVCQDLALAQHRMYGGRLCDYLNDLVMRGYKVLHKRKHGRWEGFLRYIFHTVPRAVRDEYQLFWLCTLAFLIPYLALWSTAWVDISWIQSLLGAEGMMSMEAMYGGDTLAHLRSKHGSNFMMFCFYIYNNVGIDFRIFAGGVFFGIGSLFFLLFNGLHIGASAGYVHYACDPDKFYSFVVGHSSLELIGMVLSGMAGMVLGLALLKPGRMRRKDAVAEAGKRSLPLIIGGAGMTALAAVIEGFWSAQPIHNGIKYAFGASLWFLLILYLIFAGRRSSHGA